MPNTIRIKRRLAGGATGAPASLANAELAFNEQDSVLYYGVGTGGAGGTATTILSIAGPGAFLTLGTAQTVSGDKTFTGNVSLGDLATATTPSAAENSTKVATTAYVKAQAYTTTATRLDQFAAPTADVNLGSVKITSLADPVNAQDAATKNYVDAARSGLDVKASVRVASTAAITVTYSATGGTSARGQITEAPNTLDGVTLAANDRLLLKNQASGAQNGIWVVSTLGTGVNGVWDRAADFDADTKVTSGAFTFVEEGSIADTGWVLATNNPITIGGASGTALAFNLFSSAGGGVSTFSGGSTGLTPSTASNGAVVLAGTLAATNGGTGVNNGSYTITLGGNISTGGSFSLAGAFATSVTVTGTTSITLPTSGTVLSDGSTVDCGTF